MTTPEGRQTAFTYDAAAWVTSMKRVAYGTEGPTWTYTYSAEDPDDAGTPTVADPDQDKTIWRGYRISRLVICSYWAWWLPGKVGSHQRVKNAKQSADDMKQRVLS